MNLEYPDTVIARMMPNMSKKVACDYNKLGARQRVITEKSFLTLG
jgi:hypothetical protein